MKKSFFFVLFALGLTMGLTSAAFSQPQTGSIRGVVTDTEGNPLPGVTIKASSEALMGTLDYVTSEAGIFRFPTVPPGTYTLEAKMLGFKTVRRAEIIVRLGMTATVNITMEMTTLEEELTVTANPPAVDVQRSKIAVTYDKDIIDNIPMTRDIYDIVNAAPGATSEGVSYRRTTTIHGGTVQDNTYRIDGVDICDPDSGYHMTNLNFETIDEVEMITGAHMPETGVKGGAYINVVTRSGGNKFSGGALIYYAYITRIKILSNSSGLMSKSNLWGCKSRLQRSFG